MNKKEFLDALRRGLSQLPAEEIEKQTEYYSELIDDMVEDGMSEYEATERLGSVQKIYEDILRDMPLPLLVKTRAKPRGGWTALSIVLIVLGSPIWLSLAIAAFAVVLAVYACIWAVVIAAFAVVLALVLCAVSFGVVFVRLLFISLPAALVAIAAALVTGGLAIAAVLMTLVVAKLILRATAAISRGIKNMFIRRER